MSWKIKIPNHEMLQVECPDGEDLFDFLMQQFNIRCRTYSEKKKIAYCEKISSEKTNPAFKLPKKN